MKPTIYLGADHAGWRLKEAVETHLRETGYEIVDMGNEYLVETDDYPDFGHAVAKRVASEENALGIVSCGNAQGICIVANKVKGVRAATGFSEEAAKTTREDDDANVLCLPGRMMSEEDALAVVDTFLGTPFSEADRHERRLAKVKSIENQEFGS